MSYDDGFEYDRKLCEIAARYGIRLTLNINSNCVGGADRVTADELCSFAAAGHEIAVHGAQHIAPGNVWGADGIREVLECRQALERLLGTIIRGMAYPDSGITQIVGRTTKDEIKSYVRALGLDYARTIGGDNDRFDLPDDWYEWFPTAHHDNPQMLKYLDEFLALDVDAQYVANCAPRLFTLWGHSHEYHRNGNWERFETFCQKAGGRGDIWYATCIELCDYARAFRSLRFNVERTVVYNPAPFDIWFDADGKPVRVGAGKTLRLGAAHDPVAPVLF